MVEQVATTNLGPLSSYLSTYRLDVHAQTFFLAPVSNPVARQLLRLPTNVRGGKEKQYTISNTHTPGADLFRL